jgi:hypothetical protein
LVGGNKIRTVDGRAWLQLAEIWAELILKANIKDTGIFACHGKVF